MEGSSNQYAIAADRYVSDMNPSRNYVPVATRISVTNFSRSENFSSYYVEDASLFSLFKHYIGLHAPKRFIPRKSVLNRRVDVSGDNLFTITDYRG